MAPERKGRCEPEPWTTPKHNKLNVVVERRVDDATHVNSDINGDGTDGKQQIVQERQQSAGGRKQATKKKQPLGPDAATSLVE